MLSMSKKVRGINRQAACQIRVDGLYQNTRWARALQRLTIRMTNKMYVMGNNEWWQKLHDNDHRDDQEYVCNQEWWMKIPITWWWTSNHKQSLQHRRLAWGHSEAHSHDQLLWQTCMISIGIVYRNRMGTTKKSLRAAASLRSRTTAVSHSRNNPENNPCNTNHQGRSGFGTAQDRKTHMWNLADVNRNDPIIFASAFIRRVKDHEWGRPQRKYIQYNIPRNQKG